MKTTRQIIVLLTLALLVWTGCDSVNTATENPDAPAAVPEEAFKLNVDFFKQDLAANKDQAAVSHFLAATWRVNLANLVTTTILFLPMSLTHAIQQVEPVYDGEGFVWAADTLINGQKHGIELKATPRLASIDWIMRISFTEEETGIYYRDFVLYTARTGTQTSAGDFQIFFPKQGRSQQVMDGTYDVEDDTHYQLSFIIPRAVPDLGGLSATYQREDNWTTLDLVGPDGNTHLIEWNEVTHEGALTASDYNNGQRSCWDKNLFNTTCPVL